ncbi:MAG: (d)CMP kinase [Candidatus Sericytochromatia bacterium]|nr:(d)CMP kinase [Candidatus Sericytochromatia bacterium]
MTTLLEREADVERAAGRAGRLTIAIDGPAGAGKSTVAQRVATRLGYVYIDTGAMYRGVTWKALHLGLGFEESALIAAMAAETTIALLPPSDMTGKQHVLVDGHDVTAEIRLPEVSAHVSGVAAVPAVRAVLTAQQQAMGMAGGVVMDGRDIGTAVFPHAEVKIFLTASTRERTRRRWNELLAQGIEVDLHALEQDIAARDLADSQRAVAPLRPADDAVIVHSDDRSIENVVDAILGIVDERRRAHVPATP